MQTARAQGPVAGCRHHARKGHACVKHVTEMLMGLKIKGERINKRRFCPHNPNFLNIRVKRTPPFEGINGTHCVVLSPRTILDRALGGDEKTA